MSCIRLLRLMAVMAAMLLAGALLQGCAPSPLASNLHRCSSAEGPLDAWCGTLNVPENPHSPGGRQIPLKIVVAQALRRDPAPDPVFVALGGPGQGAASTAGDLLALFKRYQMDRDIVFADQRGTGASNNLDCMPQDAQRKLADVVEQPLDPWSSCLKRLQADVRYYTTAYAADDLDQVRRTLGYTKINLWGASYGTRLAMVYLARHPDTVRAMVLDSAAPPDARAPLHWPRSAQRALDRLIADCASDQPCHEHFPDLAATVRAALERAAAGPAIRMADPRTGAALEGKISRDLIAGVIFGLLYSPNTAAELPQLLADAAEGDFKGLVSLALANNTSSGAFMSVYCSEDAPRFTREEAERESAGTFLGTAALDTVFKPCAIWPKGEAVGDFHLQGASQVPALVLSGAEDPVAPPDGGAQVAALLPKARQIVVPATAHLVTTRGCVPVLIGEFFKTAQAGALDARCLDKLRRPPFFFTASAGGAR